MVGGLFAAATVYDVELSNNDNFDASEAAQSFIATADSISEVAFFCGKKIVTGKYVFQLKDSTGVVLLGQALSDSAGLFEHELVFATFNPKIYIKKGVTYRLAVTHSEPQCTTNFYYNRTEYRNSEVERI